MSSHWIGLPDGINSRSLPIRDLQLHFLEAGERTAPLILLLHGFPELSYSWRKVIIPLTQLGYHIVAPDQRGYGLTKKQSNTPDTKISYDDDLSEYRMHNLVHDIIALTYALGHTKVAAVVGHDFGSTVAAYCALIRPDLFASVVMMSAPFTGPPSLPFDTESKSYAPHPDVGSFVSTVDGYLATLTPARKHYTSYFSTREANADMLLSPQGLRAFLRAYFHMKSADWPINDPRPLTGLSDAVIMPHYYIMPLHATMADVVREAVPTAEVDNTAATTWLPTESLAVYTEEFGRTGFQGGLNWYRCMRSTAFTDSLSIFSGAKIEVPAMFIGGDKDWGVYQVPGASEKMKNEACARMDDEDFVLVEGAGHWVQEKPEEVLIHLKRFLGKVDTLRS